MTSLTASVPKPLKEALVALAKGEKRSLSNFLVVELEPIVRKKMEAISSQQGEKKEESLPESSSGLHASQPSRRSSFPPTVTGLNEPEGDYRAKKGKK